MQAPQISPAESATVSVSVVIPTRNRPDLVVKAAASALGQDFADCEVIVVVDGPDPSTCNALEALRDPRLRIISLPESVGGAEARNIGVRAARGSWIAFLDDDDEWLPQKLARQIAAARRSRASRPVISSRMIVRTQTYQFTAPQRTYCPHRPVSEFLFFRKSPKDGPFAMQTSTLLAPRELLLAVPFTSGLKKHQDWDWLLRVERAAGVEFTVIEEPLVIYRAEDGRESVGNTQDWEFSLAWGNRMRHSFTPKAYSWFLATECMSRAVKSSAGIRIYAAILKQFAFDGQPSLQSTAILAAFLALPPVVRERIREQIRKWRHMTGRPIRSAATPRAWASLEMEF